MTAVWPPLGAADLQVHSAAGDGMDAAAALLDAAEAAGLDCLAITDHDDLRGAFAMEHEAEQRASSVEVIPGVELSTRSGHLLALWVREPLPPLRSLAASVEAVWRQGGVAVIPHPLSALPPAPSARRIDALLRDLAPDRRGPGTPLAIELANPTPSARLGRRRARRLNRERWRLPPTGGSDAHFAPMVASAVTRYPGSSGGDLRRAIEAGLTVAELRRTPSLRELGARRLLRQQIRAAGTTPRVLGRRLAGWPRSKRRGGNGP